MNPATAPSPAPCILALDLGQTTGWAMETSAGIVSGTVSFKPGRFESFGMSQIRCERWMQEMLRTPCVVYFEEVRRHRGTDAAHWYGALMGTVTKVCEQREVPYSGVPVGSWKKNLTGKGNSDKDAVKAKVRELGFSPSDDNEADAIGVLLWAKGVK